MYAALSARLRAPSAASAARSSASSRTRGAVRLLSMLDDFGRAGNRHDVRALREQPGERDDVRCRRVLLRGARERRSTDRAAGGPKWPPTGE